MGAIDKLDADQSGFCTEKICINLVQLTARSAAQKGDVVVLSPACAAFDRFKNFMERGKVFKQLVNEL